MVAANARCFSIWSKGVNGLMGVKSLGYVVIETRNPDAWDRFLTQVVGVMPATGGPEGVKLYRMDGRPFRFWVQQGARETFVAPGLEFADAASFNATLDALRAAGRPVEIASAEDTKARQVAALARSSDPAGNELELFHGDTCDGTPFVSPAGISKFVTGSMGMGHAVFAAPNFAECHDFYRTVLGLGDTDIPRFHLNGGGADDPGMGFAFMHADNGRHHSVALAEMPRPESGCVHIMVEVATLEEVGLAYDRMRLAGIPVSATLGKHVNDEMTSFYMQTPSGFDLEFGYDGLVIDPDTWEPTAHQKISIWGHVWAWQEAMKAGQS